jgi:tetratricopeptide (TPR) repeat protein
MKRSLCIGRRCSLCPWLIHITRVYLVVSPIPFDHDTILIEVILELGPDNLVEGITLLRRAVELSPPPHPARPITLGNLATSLSRQFRDSGEKQYLNEAFALHEEALKLVRPDDPSRASSLSRLADLHILAYVTLNSEEDSERGKYLEGAMENYSLAMQSYSESPSERYNIANKWARYADTHCHPSALGAYDIALQILPQVAGLSMDVQSHQEALNTGSDGLARNVSICAIRSGDFDKAVEFLEAGRAVFWAQVLNLRTPLEALRLVSPELEQKLRDISTTLERGSHRNKVVGTADVHAKIAVDLERERLNRLNEDYLQTLAEVRQLDGFEDFLRPRRVSTLQEAVRHARGPVVLLVENEEESRCLVMTSTNVRALSVPALPTKRLHTLVGFVQAVLNRKPIVLPVRGGESAWVSGEKGDMEEEVEVSLDGLEERAGAPFGSRPSRSASGDKVFQFVLRMLWDDLVKPLLRGFTLVVHFPPQTLILFGKHSHPPLLIVWLGNPNSDADMCSLRGPRRRRVVEKSVSLHVFAVL